MADQKPRRRQTGAYQHGVYLGPGNPGTPPENPEPAETTGRETGAYQSGERIGGPEPSSDTTEVDPPTTPPADPPAKGRGRHRRT